MLPNYEERLNEIHKSIQSMAEEIIDAHKLALEGFRVRNTDMLWSVGTKLQNIDADANKTDNEIVKVLALFGPEANDLREMVVLLKITNELVRIADGAKAYARRMIGYIERGFDFTPFEENIVRLHESSVNAVRYAAFPEDCDGDFEECFRRAHLEENKTDDYHEALEKSLLSKMCEDKEETQTFFKVMGAVRKLERVADHAVNITKLMVFARRGGVIESY